MVYIHKIFRNIIYVGTISFFYDSRPPDPRKGNRITKVLKIILYHPIRFIDHIRKILPMRLVNDIPGTNCVFTISFWGIQVFEGLSAKYWWYKHLK